jgi:ribose-phosphate pyrophosphokinase
MEEAMINTVSSRHGAGNQSLLLFGLGSSRQFAGRVGQHLGLAPSPHEEREFEDGEHKARPLLSVRDRDVFVLHSLYGEPQQSGNDKLCRMLFFIGALKDAGAGRVTAVAPYLAYARKDQKSKARDPVTTRYVAALFEAVGADAVVTVDVHNLAAFQNAFRCRTEHLDAAALFVAHFAPLVGNSAVVVVSPDAGGMKRAEQFRQQLGTAVGAPVGSAFAEKYRRDAVVSGSMLVGDVRDKVAIIVDDLVSSGTTLCRAAESCRKHGAVRVFGAATHGLFTGDAAANLAADALDALLVTDTVPAFRIEGSPAAGKVTVVSCAELVAQAISRLHAGGSITDSDAR